MNLLLSRNIFYRVIEKKLSSVSTFLWREYLFTVSFTSIHSYTLTYIIFMTLLSCMQRSHHAWIIHSVNKCTDIELCNHTFQLLFIIAVEGPDELLWILTIWATVDPSAVYISGAKCKLDHACIIHDYYWAWPNDRKHAYNVHKAKNGTFSLCALDIQMHNWTNCKWKRSETPFVFALRPKDVRGEKENIIEN